MHTTRICGGIGIIMGLFTTFQRLLPLFVPLIIYVSAQSAHSDRKPYLTEDDFARAKLVPTNATDDADMYHIDSFEGDILFPSQEMSLKDGRMRNGVKNVGARWTNGRIPYTISSSFSTEARAQIAAAVTEYNDKTCIQLVPRDPNRDTDYVDMVEYRGCQSLVGRLGYEQKLYLGGHCNRKRIIVHELMHTIGFFHEQSRADRDKYVRVNFDNIEPQAFAQFEKQAENMTTVFGAPYDYASILHYKEYSFSKNNEPTIVPLKEGVTIGQGSGLSETDIYKINAMYGCNPAVTQPTEQPSIPEGCKDKSRYCGEIADKGDCDEARMDQFVREECNETCKKDKLSWCDSATRNECKSGDVSNKCPIACGVC